MIASSFRHLASLSFYGARASSSLRSGLAALSLSTDLGSAQHHNGFTSDQWVKRSGSIIAAGLMMTTGTAGLSFAAHADAAPSSAPPSSPKVDDYARPIDLKGIPKSIELYQVSKT